MDQAIKDILEREFLSEDIAKDYGGNAYVKPHLVFGRLSEAFGPDGWKPELTERIETSEYVIQYGRIGAKDENGEWMWKENCGGMMRTYKTGKPHEPQHEINQITTYKGAVSNCYKRCAMLWGVGLHLYGDPEHEGVDPRESIAASIEKGEVEMCALMKCEPTDLRNQHFGPDNDNLGAKSPEELEGYLVFLRGLRDESNSGTSEPSDKEPPASDVDTGGQPPPSDVIKLKNGASQAQTKALRDGVITKLDVDAMRMKHFGGKTFPDDADKLKAFIKELGEI